MGFIQRVGQALQVLRKGLGDDYAFANGGGDESTMSSTYSRGNLRQFMTGTSVNWARIAGPLWTNSAFASCLLWICRNAQQAPPVVFRSAAKSGDEIVDSDLTARLLAPNPFYDWTVLQSALLTSLFSDGNAYIVVEDRDRLGRPLSLWYCPHWIIEPARRKGSSEFITHYNFYGNRGIVEEWPLDRVCHLRFGLDPTNPTKGFNAAGTILREIATDVLATNYGAASLKNRGMLGVLVTPKDGNSSVQFDPDEFVTRWRAKTTGDNTWDAIAYDVPLNAQFPNITPDTMALDLMRKYPEARIASIFGLPAQVAGLICSEGTKTYANYSEAREAGWEECILPNVGSMMRQIGAYFLPDYGSDPKLYLGIDISSVRPLQPDKDKLHTRVAKDFVAGIIDRAEARQETGREVRTEDVGVFSAQSQPKAAPTDDPNADGKQDAAKKGRLMLADDDAERKRREALLALLACMMWLESTVVTHVERATDPQWPGDPAGAIWAALMVNHSTAHWCGRVYGGATGGETQIDYLAGHAAAAQQKQFSDQFVADAKGGKYGTGDEIDEAAIQQRAHLYANALMGTFNRGWVETLADDAEITWHLGATEDHCEQCPDIATGSPYTKRTLPSLPGDGSTDCHTNCQCWLSVDGDRAPSLADVEKLR